MGGNGLCRPCGNVGFRASGPTFELCPSRFSGLPKGQVARKGGHRDKESMSINYMGNVDCSS